MGEIFGKIKLPCILHLLLVYNLIILFFSLIFQYLTELKESGARIIIGDFFKNAAQKVMCEAYKLHMTQKEGYVWFLPGWYHPDWYKLDDLRELEAKKNDSEKNDPIPDCSTDEMIQVWM